MTLLAANLVTSFVKGTYYFMAFALVGLAFGCAKTEDAGPVVAEPAGGQPTVQVKPAAGGVTFASVQPILQRSCVKCHGAQNAKGNLNLTSHETIMKGGEHGVVIVPGDPDNSRLIQFLRGHKTPRMPLRSEPLPESEIALFADWIKQGAKAS